jgi:hypothetical protein
MVTTIGGDDGPGFLFDSVTTARYPTLRAN